MRPLWMAIALAGGMGFGALAAGTEAIDPRIAENPVLAELHASDPAAAQRVLDEIEALGAPAPGQLPKGVTRGIDTIDAETQRLLDENPLFRELYARDRGATLKLIKLVTGE